MFNHPFFRGGASPAGKDRREGEGWGEEGHEPGCGEKDGGVEEGGNPRTEQPAGSRQQKYIARQPGGEVWPRMESPSFSIANGGRPPSVV